MYLPDINVWIALAFDAHLHHPVAKAWFDTVADNHCLFCRLTQQGFLRICTNPKALGSEAVTLDRAWQLYDQITADTRIHLAEEPPALESTWRRYTQGLGFSNKVWSDAYLAAFARESNLQLVTFDKGFVKFDDLNLQLLTS